jgi:hypothetical protein
MTEEANAVNIVLGYMAGQEEPPAMVVRALERLARRAHNRLQSGWDEQAVRQQWPRAFDEVEAAPCCDRTPARCGPCIKAPGRPSHRRSAATVHAVCLCCALVAAADGITRRFRRE